ncbi:MAG: DUF21 domain-containing protein [Bacteroidota bacterium]
MFRNNGTILIIQPVNKTSLHWIVIRSSICYIPNSPSFSWPLIQTGTTFLIFVLAALLLLAFTISGAEVALFSLNNKDINMLKTKQHSAAKRIITLLEEPKEVYASLLIANTFISICIAILPIS